MMRVAVYVRVSTARQVHPQTIEQPLERLRAWVAEIFARYLEAGASLFKVARILRESHICSPTGKPIWALASVRGILSNPVYTGQLYAGRMRYRSPSVRRSATHPIGRSHDSASLTPPEESIPVATIPAIVTQAQFDQVQSKLAKKGVRTNRSFSPGNNTAHPYLLRALVSCGHCLLDCIGRTLARTHYSYSICSDKFKKEAALGRRHCPSRFAPAGQLDELVWRDLCEVLSHPDELARALERAHGGHWLPQELQARRENLRKGRTSLSQQLDRLTDAYLHRIIPLPEYDRRRRELEQRDHALAQQEGQLCAQTERHEEIAGLAISIQDFCARVQSGLANADFAQKRQLIELLVDRVIVKDTEVEIRYVIPTSPGSQHVRFFSFVYRLSPIPRADWDDRP